MVLTAAVFNVIMRDLLHSISHQLTEAEGEDFIRRIGMNILV